MYMKKHYPGLLTQKISVECQPFMQATSNVKIKAKTKVQEWRTEETQVEMGIGDINISTLE